MNQGPTIGLQYMGVRGRPQTTMGPRFIEARVLDRREVGPQNHRGALTHQGQGTHPR